MNCFFLKIEIVWGGLKMNTNLQKNKNVIVYEDGEIELKVSVEKDTILLFAEDIAALFGVQRPAIVKHIGNIYKDEELVQNSTCSILEQVAKDGKKRKVNFYNLDVILSVGYRVNSKKATRFRQWATSVLKEYITNGYVINIHKVTEQRLMNLENDMKSIKSKIKNDQLELKQGIFYDGQIFDAYVFVNNLLKSAKKEVVLIDNYLDESVLTIFSKYPNISFTAMTKEVSKQLKIDIEKYNKQYSNLTLKSTNRYHDRFFMIDDTKAYHVGASLKDLANKVFAFSEIDVELLKEVLND